MRMYAKSAVIGIAIAISAASSSIAVEQPEGMAGMPGVQGRMTPPTPEQRIDQMVSRMAEHLNLTAEQQTELKSIFLEQNNKHRKLAEETQTRVQSVLTDEQKQKLEESRQAPRGAPAQDQPPMR